MSLFTPCVYYWEWSKRHGRAVVPRLLINLWMDLHANASSWRSSTDMGQPWSNCCYPKWGCSCTFPARSANEAYPCMPWLGPFGNWNSSTTPAGGDDDARTSRCMHAWPEMTWARWPPIIFFFSLLNLNGKRRIYACLPWTRSYLARSLALVTLLHCTWARLFVLLSTSLRSRSHSAYERRRHLDATHDPQTRRLHACVHDKLRVWFWSKLYVSYFCFPLATHASVSLIFHLSSIISPLSLTPYHSFFTLKVQDLYRRLARCHTSHTHVVTHRFTTFTQFDQGWPKSPLLLCHEGHACACVVCL